MNSPMYPQLVVRFKRHIEFPRFSVNLGERWNFEIGPKSQALLHAIKLGERFPFAGGDCLSQDVEVLYEGPSGREHAIAAGYIVNAANADHAKQAEGK
jgi:hypothetical protein